MITLFDTNENEFITNGLGSLSDATTCPISEEANGAYELEMTYPINGLHYLDLSLRKLIFAKPNPYVDPQPFRIYAISKPINGIVTVNAQHISYDLTGYPVQPFTAENIQNALIQLKTSSVLVCPFNFITNKETVGEMIVSTPRSIRSLLGGSTGSIIDIYGGDYEFDRFDVKLHDTRGVNRGVSIRYGKNLLDLKQEENCSSVYTGVYPFWYSQNDGTLLELPEKIINAPGTYDFTRIYPLDITSYFQEAPTEQEIRNTANNFMTNTGIGIPLVSISVAFAQLSQSEEYKDFAILETVNLWDDVNIEFPNLGVSATARCIKTTYDAITNKYTNIELGDVKSNLATTISAGSIAVNAKIDGLDAFFTKEVDNLKIDVADINVALIGTVNVTYLEANYAHMTDGVIDNATIDYGKVNNLDVEVADIVSAKIALVKIGTAQIEDGAITTALIADAAITTVQIKDASITDAKVVDLSANSITTGTLSVERLIIRGTDKSLVFALNNITGAMQSEAVDTLNGEILSSRTITADKIVVASITANEIHANTITANEIATGTITAAKMVAGTITAVSGIIANAAISTAQIADASITSAKIDTITADKIHGNTLTLGGTNNLSGLFKLKDTTGLIDLVTMDNTGILVKQASYRVLESTGLQIIVGSLDNLIPDPSFEGIGNASSSGRDPFTGEAPALSNAGGTGWKTGTGIPKIVYSPEGIQFGDCAASVNSVNTLYCGTDIIKSSTNYTLSAFVTPDFATNATGKSINYYILIEIKDASNVILQTIPLAGNITNSYIVPDAGPINRNPVKRISVTFSTPINAYYARVTISSGGSDQNVVYDGIQMVEGNYPVAFTSERESKLDFLMSQQVFELRYDLNVNGNMLTYGKVSTRDTPISSTVAGSISGAFNIGNDQKVSALGFATAFHMTTTIVGGYRQHISMGGYRNGSGWDGGMFIGLSNNDTAPSEFFILGLTGKIYHSGGNISFPGETHFFTVAYADPWIGHSCALKVNGDVGISGTLLSGSMTCKGNLSIGGSLMGGTDMYIWGNTIHFVTSTNSAYAPCKASAFTVISLEKYKQDIELIDSKALDIVINSDIYKYRLKDEVKRGIIDNYNYGFIIGDSYRTPKELINNEAISQYSMGAIAWKAIQELSTKIIALEEELELLKTA